MEKKESVLELARNFARDNKVSVAKATALANAIYEAAKPQGMGRKPSGETIKVRTKLKALLESGKMGQTFTVKELCKKMRTDAVTMNNAVRYLKENDGMLVFKGAKPKEPGETGRSENLWAIK